MDSQTLHKALLAPRTFDSEVAGIDFKETHISRLYFVGDRVYKIKKPVDFGFLDFTTLEKRAFFCQEELRLNQRFCNGIYLEVAEIREQNGTITINGPGHTIEYAVVMKRLPEDNMLPRLLARNDPALPRRVAELARHVARLYQQLQSIGPATDISHLDVVRNNWQENFLQTEPFIAKTISSECFDLLKRHILDFENRQAELFRRRERQGWVRDGHGDLHCEHICFMDDKIAIYDCIEFNRRFRIADILADLAFLVMDLEMRNHYDLATIVRENYFAIVGQTADTDLLLPFYQIYRAYVRGKVESFLSADAGADASTREAAAARAKQYFNQALGYLCRTPQLVLTCGLMGTGKTTLARKLAIPMGARLLRSDVIRKELAGLSPEQRRAEDYGKGLYSSETSQATYDALRERALETLKTGRPVIVDASFHARRDRERFRLEAKNAGYRVWTVEVTCDRAVALQRLDHRQKHETDASDGRCALYDQQAACFEATGNEPGVLRVDGQAEIHSTIDHLLRRFLREE
ncbi:AAA family ATPase [Syntrophotalea acetylenica]|uniref:bifunctional aminoglycoside phosphotransferase/ATP-binding protein n=1 Tax=Syntrophotalea acetylenica TaxID=29542 RepID=UPI002A36B7E1|nr:AAA family ATPase [Syntrophotalea acetylenica]MDY0262920.1 AAA family ATPase [Syntrophotalea acetylenica]